MNKRLILLSILVLSLLIPGLFLLNLEGVFSNGSTREEIENTIMGYRLRVWLSWIIMAVVAVYYKWTTDRDIFFKMIYLVMVIAFGIEGLYTQRMVNSFDMVTNFLDTYTFSFLMSMVNIITVIAVTGFLHLSVWWFTKKRHRE